MSNPASPQAAKPWTSRAWWPDECCPAIGNYSEDTHYSEAEARAVCQLLHERGFGGDGKFFPVRTEVVANAVIGQMPVRIDGGAR